MRHTRALIQPVLLTWMLNPSLARRLLPCMLTPCLAQQGSGPDAVLPAAPLPTMLCASGWGQPDGLLRVAGRKLRQPLAAPAPALFWAAGLSFSRAHLIKEVGGQAEGGWHGWRPGVCMAAGCSSTADSAAMMRLLIAACLAHPPAGAVLSRPALAFLRRGAAAAAAPVVRRLGRLHPAPPCGIPPVEPSRAAHLHLRPPARLAAAAALAAARGGGAGWH